MTEEKKYLFGPVPSRRLGLSLGVDIVPFKTCTLDCIYCQIGKTSEKTIERKDYVVVEAVLEELKDRLAQGLTADFITISGSGEPTLNSQLGQIIDGIKKITDIPVAVLTNGTLLTDKSVRADCAKADVVVPSLDAGDQQTFQKINRPHRDISIEKLVDGLCAFRDEFSGQIWLEVFLVEGINTDANQIAKIKTIIERISPDKVHLNTAVRPTAEKDVKRLDAEKLQAVAVQLGQRCEVVADFALLYDGKHIEGGAKDVLSMLKRRPCSLNDISSGLGIRRDVALKYVTYFQQQGVVDTVERDGTTFFKAD
ncbi:MAG: radical SAM protein [Planctomycetes bacterium]|nr:radical SAM protein [Planctomycetota bacterium]